MQTKRLIGLTLLTLILLSAFAALNPTNGENITPYWEYRKSHVIQPQADAGTDYSIKITVHYGAGSDSGNDVWLNSKCQTDFDDIRFTDNDAFTLLGYWIESKVDSNNAVIWVKVTDDLSTDPVTIYIYYGNPSATSASDGQSAFLFFDDFSAGTIDANKWNQSAGEGNGVAEINSGQLKIYQNPTGSYYWGRCVYTITPNWSPSNTLITFTASKTNHYASAWNSRNFIMDPVGQTFLGGRSEPQTDYVVTCPAPDASAPSNYKGINGDAAFGAIAVSVYIKSFNSTHAIYNSTITSGTANPSNYVLKTVSVSSMSFSQFAYVLHGADYGNSGATFYDNFKMRRCVAPEPVNGAWGAEEKVNLQADWIGHGVMDMDTVGTVSTRWYVAGEAGAVSLDSFLYSFDGGSGFVNQTWQNFPTANNSWANTTVSLSGYALGFVVHWTMYANDSSGRYVILPDQNFTVSASITLYFTQGGGVKINGVNKANGSLTTFYSEQAVDLSAVPSSGYGFYNFTGTKGGGWAVTDNPVSYNLTVPDVVTCRFVTIGSGVSVGPTADLSEYTDNDSMLAFLIVAVVVVAIVVPLLFTASRGVQQRRQDF